MENKEEWKRKISPEAYHVLFEKGTEPPFANKYYNNKEKGVYYCAACGSPLFSSKSKFDSHTGWPSFCVPVSPDAVKTEVDKSHGMERVEVHCAHCGGHLGHVFDDGPLPTNLRYCTNSAALNFKKDK